MRGQHRNPFRADDADYHQKKGSNYVGKHRKGKTDEEIGDAIKDAGNAVDPGPAIAKIRAKIKWRKK